jgi:hypothetical protein
MTELRTDLAALGRVLKQSLKANATAGARTKRPARPASDSPPSQGQEG